MEIILSIQVKDQSTSSILYELTTDYVSGRNNYTTEVCDLLDLYSNDFIVTNDTLVKLQRCMDYIDSEIGLTQATLDTELRNLELHTIRSVASTNKDIIIDEMNMIDVIQNNIRDNFIETMELLQHIYSLLCSAKSLYNNHNDNINIVISVSS